MYNEFIYAHSVQPLGARQLTGISYTASNLTIVSVALLARAVSMKTYLQCLPHMEQKPQICINIKKNDTHFDKLLFVMREGM